ncbi:MAG: ribonuclease H-like domain-containing protein [Candidatus Hydrogenedentota bacterium]
MANMRDKLDALMKKQGLMTGAEWVQQKQQEESDRAAGRFDMPEVLPGEAVGEAGAAFYLVRQDFPASFMQGNVPLGAVLDTQSQHIAFSSCDPELADFDPRTTLFMDTETIGLAGGTGTVAFLVGVGYFVDDGTFRLDQCFMRDFDEEEPMLAFLAERFIGYEAVVGYNSKCFDLPLLRTRFIQNRIPFRLDGFRHFDLMHAARRFWKDRLGSCTLNNVERHILALTRKGDVASHLIPQLWFDYLRTRDARRLKPVFYHHQMDILSLVSLTGLISQLLETPGGAGFTHAEDRLSFVRIHFRQRRYEQVVTNAMRFIEAEESGPLRQECLTMLALAHKRLKDFAAMAETFERLVEEFPSDISARLELAKYHEHRSRDLVRAEALCQQALDRLDACRTVGRAPGVPATEYDAVSKRLARIRRKLRRGATGDDTGQLDME